MISWARRSWPPIFSASRKPRPKFGFEGAYGQTALENTAHRVGGQVRKAIKDIGGTMPEDLPSAGDIRDIRKGLKATQRALKKVDKNKKHPPGD